MFIASCPICGHPLWTREAHRFGVRQPQFWCPKCRRVVVAALVRWRERYPKKPF